MNYIKHIRKILSLDVKQLDQLNTSSDELVYIPTRDSCFLGARLSLLPRTLNRHFLSKVSYQPLGSENAHHYDVILRLIREDMYTKRLDFYSRQLNDGGNETDAIRNELLHHQWLQQPSEKEGILIFRYEELELTVIFETLADVQEYPFWHLLNNYFHIHRPSEGHTPALSRYAHFIVRTQTGANDL